MNVIGKYVSIWDDGLEVKSKCIVNTDTMEVHSIEISDIDTDELEVLRNEFVEFTDASPYYLVGTKEDFEDGFVDYWRD